MLSEQNKNKSMNQTTTRVVEAVVWLSGSALVFVNVVTLRWDG